MIPVEFTKIVSNKTISNINCEVDIRPNNSRFYFIANRIKKIYVRRNDSYNENGYDLLPLTVI